MSGKPVRSGPKERTGQWLWDKPELRSIFSDLSRKEQDERDRGRAKKEEIRARQSAQPLPQDTKAFVSAK